MCYRFPFTKKFRKIIIVKRMNERRNNTILTKNKKNLIHFSGSSSSGNLSFAG
jgi:hypothetical protein